MDNEMDIDKIIRNVLLENDETLKQAIREKELKCSGLLLEVVWIKQNEDTHITLRIEDESMRDSSYFKVFNGIRRSKSEEEVRLSFFSRPYIINHKGELPLWELTKKDMRRIMKVLKSKPVKQKELPEDHPFKTVWEVLIYLWDWVLGFTQHKDFTLDIQKYPEGCLPGSPLLKEVQFVPLNTPIPDYYSEIRVI